MPRTIHPPKTNLTEAQQHTIWKAAPLTPLQRRVWWLYYYGDAKKPSYSWRLIADRIIHCQYRKVTAAFMEANRILMALFDAEVARLVALPLANPDEEKDRYAVTVYAGADTWSAADTTTRQAIEGRR